MICENCSSKHDGSYGSGRFCNSICAHGFSTKCNREEISRKVSKTLGGKNYKPKEKFCLCCGKKLTHSQRKFCTNYCTSEYYYLLFINRWKLNIENGISGKGSTSRHLKKYLLKKYYNSCQKCGWNIINKYLNSLPLELHHIDGDYTNNREENLELLCPNCHSLTSTYKASNKKSKRTHR